MKRIALVLCMVLFSQTACGRIWEESPILAECFRAAGVEGSFVLYDVDADVLIGHNRVRANTRFVPASTFKIANSLIGLSTGSVPSVDAVLPYGGQPQPYPQWQRDMGLREAIRLSNVAIYQELARRIGLKRMQAGVDRLGYGNRRLGTQVDQFWLTGPLEISAVEQVLFLARLAKGTLPMDPGVQQSVREILLLEERDTGSLYGKTGWENAPRPGIGWGGGWGEQDGALYAFALNLDVRTQQDADRRISLGKACLQALGVF